MCYKRACSFILFYLNFYVGVYVGFYWEENDVVDQTSVSGKCTERSWSTADAAIVKPLDSPPRG